ncbi:MAG: type II toxin-antitoxin system Phd/YefM family antitoxin [Defluviicoccus sp.]|nr:type II toxin-antitoxin system Phd/YefM family antitoxin [Defluviicoccus sp.]
MRQVQLREAKARLSALVDGAARGETAIITRHGKPRAVILGIDEWTRLRDVPSFGRPLLASGLEDGDLLPRDTAPPRDTAL